MFRRKPPAPRPSDPQPPDATGLSEVAAPEAAAPEISAEIIPEVLPAPEGRAGIPVVENVSFVEAAPTETTTEPAGPEVHSPELLSPKGGSSKKPPLPPGFKLQRQVRPWVWWTAGGLTLVVGLLAASWFLLPIKSVDISGNNHLTTAEVRQLAGIRPEMGWLYYGHRQARGLLASPWVLAAQVTRRFPDTVVIQLTERQPFMRFSPSAQKEVAVAADGTLLPGAGDLRTLPQVSGWGPERLKEAVTAARALSRYTVQSVTYTPSGLSVKTAGGTVWSGDPNSLVKYAGSISMYPNKKVNIYPWGVSVQQ